MDNLSEGNQHLTTEGRKAGCGLALLLAGIGAVVGGFLGAQWYIHLGPPWAQFGYEFEGLFHVAAGGVLGFLVGALAGGLWSSGARSMDLPDQPQGPHSTEGH